MRPVLLACLAVVALAGCMEPSDDDWDAYDSGRGLAFGMALTVLLIVGVVVLVVNLTSSSRGASEPAKPDPAAAPPPPASPPPTGWETIESSAAPSRKPSATKRGATKGKRKAPPKAKTRGP